MENDPQALLAEIAALKAEALTLRNRNTLLEGLLSSIQTLTGLGSIGSQHAEVRLKLNISLALEGKILTS